MKVIQANNVINTVSYTLDGVTLRNIVAKDLRQTVPEYDTPLYSQDPVKFPISMQEEVNKIKLFAEEQTPKDKRNHIPGINGTNNKKAFKKKMKRALKTRETDLKQRETDLAEIRTPTKNVHVKKRDNKTKEKQL